MTDDKRARRDEAERLFADELERELAMTMTGVSGRRFVAHVATGSMGLWALMLFAAQRLHG